MDRKKALELFTKNIDLYGDTGSDFLVPKDMDTVNRALNARDIAEEALANEVLKNTGVKIPGKGSTKSDIEKFLQDIRKERYPELKDAKINLSDDMKGNAGLYIPQKREIVMSPERVKKNPILAVSDLLHESAHEYDDKILKHEGKPIDLAAFRKVRDKIKGANVDPTDIYEAVADVTQHHAKIPKLREGSFGLGALKSMLKSGNFKSIPVIAQIAGVATALSSGDATALIPILDMAESAGESPEEENRRIREMDRKAEERRLKKDIYNNYPKDMPEKEKRGRLEKDFAYWNKIRSYLNEK